MTDDKQNENKPVLIENDSALNKTTAKTIAKAGDAEPTPKSSSQNASPHLQLLQLAKNFALDGGLIPTEKQMPLEDRCRKRERLAHLRKQQNLELIVNKSLSYCSEQDISARADADWFSSYIALAEDIGNKTMRELWAKILAKEVSNPGSFSLKAIQTFRQLSMFDAKLIAKVCSLTVKDLHNKHLRRYREEDV